MDKLKIWYEEDEHRTKIFFFLISIVQAVLFIAFILFLYWLVGNMAEGYVE